MITIYIPRDTTTISLGADKIAVEIAEIFAEKQLALSIVRNGSRGLYWLEPMIEIETLLGRIAYGPVMIADIDTLITAMIAVGKSGKDETNHPLYLGLTEDIPYLKNQQRLTFSRVGITDPLSIDHFLKHGGFEGLQNAITKTSAAIVAEVTESGLRGRGGAAFPTGIKWQTVLVTESDQKYIVCNADEGDSGTFADRMIMECDPFILIEGMIIAGLAVGATRGYIYLREEYRLAQQVLEQAIELAKDQGYLGAQVCGSDHEFRVEVRMGAGAYICGEETALLDSLEGRRGMVRTKPPVPAVAGFFGKPTVVNNVLSLATVPVILARGPLFYRDYGLGRSRGTIPMQLAGNIRRAGLVEVAFGISLRELVTYFGGGTRSGKSMKAIQVGGPLGAYLPSAQWDTLLDYEAFMDIGAILGHGGVVVFDETVDMAEQAQFAMEFCAVESCGKCTPCRIGSTRGVEVIERIRQGKQRKENSQLLIDLCETMKLGSLCAMGGMTPSPVMSAFNSFREDFFQSPELDGEI
jgi:formate dehydrogenase iron-sulfur subunit